VVSFPQVFQPKFCTHLSSPNTCCMPCPSHASRFNHPKNIWWGVQIKLFFTYFSPLSFTSFLFGPNIFLSTLFSNNHCLRSSLNVSDQVSHPYKTTGKIMFLYIVIFILLDRKLEDKMFVNEWQQEFPNFRLLLISSWIEFWFVRFSQIFELFHTVKRNIINLSTISIICYLY